MRPGQYQSEDNIAVIGGDNMVVYAIISAVGGIVTALILSKAIRQRKSCSCHDCAWHSSNGLCIHKNPMIGPDKMCLSYEERKDYWEDYYGY